MQANKVLRLPEVILKNESTILQQWIKHQLAAMKAKAGFISEEALKHSCKEFIGLFTEACQSGTDDITASNWRKTREMLADLSSSRALQGFSPEETAMFIFALKQPLFDAIRTSVKDAADLADEVWTITVLLDKLGLFTCEVFIKSREEVIKRQQREMLELSTPVFRLWDKVLALPLIGTLDSHRTQMVMEALLTQLKKRNGDRRAHAD